MSPRKAKKLSTPTPEELQVLHDLPTEGWQDEETEMQALDIRTGLQILGENSEGSEYAEKELARLVQKMTVALENCRPVALPKRE